MKRDWTDLVISNGLLLIYVPQSCGNFYDIGITLKKPVLGKGYMACAWTQYTKPGRAVFGMVIFTYYRS